MSWRPKGWEYGAWQKDERFLRNPPVITEERLYNAFEAGADAILKALREMGKPVPPHASVALHTKVAGTWVFIPDEGDAN